jgi:hypothetical protein
MFHESQIEQTIKPLTFNTNQNNDIMCQLCPGTFEFVEEKTGYSSPVLHGGNKDQNTPKTFRKKIMRPCTCHCGSGPMEHMENGRAYCPTCRHYLRMTSQ